MMSSIIHDMKERHFIYFNNLLCAKGYSCDQDKHPEVHQCSSCDRPIMMDGGTAFLSGNSIIILPSTIHLIFIVFFIPSEIYNSLCMRCSLLTEGTMAFFFSVREFNLHPFLEYHIFPLPNPRTHSMEVDLQLCRFQNNP